MSPVTTSSQVLLAPKDRSAAWASDLQARTREAAAMAAARLGLPSPSPIHVVTFGSQFEFHDYLRAKPTHVVAVARPDESEIIILRPAFFRETPEEQLQTLTHEMAHLILGKNARGKMPAWLNEGLAQLVARQGNWGMDARLTFAGSFGVLTPLSELEDTLAIGGGDAQPLAYAQGLAVTQFLIKRTFPGTNPDDHKPLAQLIADPRKGPAFLSDLWNAKIRDSLEWQWKDSRKTAWNWIAALSSGGFVWGFATILFLLASWRKRRMNQMARERFAEEEERDRALGLEIPPWEYEGDEPPENGGDRR